MNEKTKKKMAIAVPDEDPRFISIQLNLRERTVEFYREKTLRSARERYDSFSKFYPSMVIEKQGETFSTRVSYGFPEAQSRIKAMVSSFNCILSYFGKMEKNFYFLLREDITVVEFSEERETPSKKFLETRSSKGAAGVVHVEKKKFPTLIKSCGWPTAVNYFYCFVDLLEKMLNEGGI